MAKRKVPAPPSKPEPARLVDRMPVRLEIAKHLLSYMFPWHHLRKGGVQAWINPLTETAEDVDQKAEEGARLCNAALRLADQLITAAEEYESKEAT